MRLQTREFSRYVDPADLHTAVAEVRTEVNTFLETLNLNDVADIRYETVACVPDAGDRQAKMFHLAIVIYLEA